MKRMLRIFILMILLCSGFCYAQISNVWKIGDLNPVYLNKEMYLIKVNNDSQNYIEDTLGVVKTDGSGLIELKPR